MHAEKSNSEENNADEAHARYSMLLVDRKKDNDCVLEVLNRRQAPDGYTDWGLQHSAYMLSLCFFIYCLFTSEK